MNRAQLRADPGTAAKRRLAPTAGRLISHHREVMVAWERFVSGENIVQGVPVEVLLSWHRCRDVHGVDPYLVSPPRARGGQPFARIQQRLRAVGRDSGVDRRAQRELPCHGNRQRWPDPRIVGIGRGKPESSGQQPGALLQLVGVDDRNQWHGHSPYASLADAGSRAGTLVSGAARLELPGDGRLQLWSPGRQWRRSTSHPGRARSRSRRTRSPAKCASSTTGSGDGPGETGWRWLTRSPRPRGTPTARCWPSTRPETSLRPTIWSGRPWAGCRPVSRWIRRNATGGSPRPCRGREKVSAARPG